MWYTDYTKQISTFEPSSMYSYLCSFILIDYMKLSEIDSFPTAYTNMLDTFHFLR